MFAPRAALFNDQLRRGVQPTEHARLDAGQDSMPGAAQTVDIIADSVHFDGAQWLLQMAGGKGTAASTQASRHTYRIVCVEPHAPFIHQSVDRFSRLGLGVCGWSRVMAGGYRSGPA